MDISKCKICPRECNANRNEKAGYCGGKDKATVVKSTLHFYEEPCISGTRGSGAVFFGGCPLKCVYCQNKEISRPSFDFGLNANELCDLFVSLQDRGAHNVNLVTAGHFLHVVIPALEKAKKKVKIPFVYNTSAYEKVDAIRRLDGLIDVYLPDYKYASTLTAKRYSSAPDYPHIATMAIQEMLRQQPKCIIENGLMQNGVIIRHLVLPLHRLESIKAVNEIATKFSGAMISLMRQYTPDFYDGELENLKRKVTNFEYNSVLAEVNRLAISGYMQLSQSASAEFTPNFSQKEF